MLFGKNLSWGGLAVVNVHELQRRPHEVSQEVEGVCQLLVTDLETDR